MKPTAENYLFGAGQESYARSGSKTGRTPAQKTKKEKNSTNMPRKKHAKNKATC